MTVYELAKRHAWRMAFATLFAILFVVGMDVIYGHSIWAFAAAVVVLIWMNMPMLRLNCPRCGQNVFFRGFFLWFWPRKVCSKCGLVLDESEQP